MQALRSLSPIFSMTACAETITLEGEANGALYPEPAAYAKYFTGRYEHRGLTGGSGHNLPRSGSARIRAGSRRCRSALGSRLRRACCVRSSADPPIVSRRVNPTRA